MSLYVNVVSNQTNKVQTFTVGTENPNSIEIEDLDMIDLEFDSNILYNEIDTKLVIGGTSYQIEIAQKVNTVFYYRLSRDNQDVFFNGNFSNHVSRVPYQTKSGWRRFTRLFLNEIGLCKIYLQSQNTEYYLGSVTVSSKKITQNDDNFKIITEYLLYQGYFDSKHLYKSIVEGQKSTLPNSLLEVLRKLVSFLKSWHDDLHKFQVDSIKILSSSNTIKNYEDNQTVDIDSIDWLISNLNFFIPSTRNNKDISIAKKPYKIERILVNENNYNYDSYENRIIHGYIFNLIKIITSKQKQLDTTTIARTKVRSFRELLLYCFNQLLEKHFTDVKSLGLRINHYLKSHIPVSTPLYEYPKKIDGFYSKPHYKKVLDLINYSKNIFSIDFGLDNLSLEIESFDRLFEVYCFYLIRDIIENVFFNGNSKQDIFKYPSKSNNLSGCYSFSSNDVAVSIQLYYEQNPKDFIQVSSSFHPYIPDFVIGFSKNEKTNYIILDAKYKKYRKQSLEEDLSNLTLKYLHKIKLTNDSKNKVVGLFPLSLSSGTNNRGSIFKGLYVLNTSILPQIGNIELDPKSVNLRENNIVDVLTFGLSTL